MNFRVNYTSPIVTQRVKQSQGAHRFDYGKYESISRALEGK